MSSGVSGSGIGVVLVDCVNGEIPKANVENSANWDTAFGWGNHSAGNYIVSGTVNAISTNMVDEVPFGHIL